MGNNYVFGKLFSMAFQKYIRLAIGRDEDFGLVAHKKYVKNFASGEGLRRFFYLVHFHQYNSLCGRKITWRDL